MIGRSEADEAIHALSAAMDCFAEFIIGRAHLRDPLARDDGLGLSRPYSDLSIFQKIGVAGPSSTPVIDFRHALAMRYCPSGM